MKRNSCPLPDSFTDFIGGNEERKKVWPSQALKSTDPDDIAELFQYGNRHLLIKISNLGLSPEKAHFIPESETFRVNSQYPAANITDFLQIEMKKLTTGVENKPINFT